MVSEDKAADVMTEELDAHFKDGYTLNFDVPLNKLMVDWDIKEFLKTHVGINSWEDLAEEDKRKCYRTIPRRVFLIGMRFNKNLIESTMMLCLCCL